MEGKKKDRPQFFRTNFKKIAKELIEKDNGSLETAISIARDAMQQLETGQVKPSLLVCSEVLGLNPPEYKNQKERVCQVGYVQQLHKGDRAWWYLKENEPGWTLNESEISQREYKQFFWTCIEELLEQAGAPVEELANEFDVKNKRRITKRRKKKESTSEESQLDSINNCLSGGETNTNGI